MQKILAKSLRLQESSREQVKIDDGLSIRDLEQIAKEVGISPEFLHQAINSAKDQFEIRETSGLFGSPSRMEIIGTVPGELNEETISVLTKKLRRDTKKRGILETVGKSFGWSTMASNEAELTFDALSTDGKTELNLHYSASNIKFLFYFFPVLPLILSLVALVKNVFIFLPIFAVFLTMASIAHFSFNRYFRRKSKKHIKMYAELEDLAGAKVDPPGDLSTNQTSPRNSLDLDAAEGYLLEESDPADGSKMRSGKRTKKRRIP